MKNDTKLSESRFYIMSRCRYGSCIVQWMYHIDVRAASGRFFLTVNAKMYVSEQKFLVSKCKTLVNGRKVEVIIRWSYPVAGFLWLPSVLAGTGRILPSDMITLLLLPLSYYFPEFSRRIGPVRFHLGISNNHSSIVVFGHDAMAAPHRSVFNRDGYRYNVCWSFTVS